jgi:hypothetical protein
VSADGAPDDFAVRDLPIDQRQWASAIFLACDGFRQQLADARAPAWMMQEVNTLRADFEASLDRVRPTRGLRAT